MKVIYLGANCRKGTSEKTGRPYEIAELSYCVQDAPSSKNTPDGKTLWVYSGYGYRVRTIPISPSHIHNFKDVAALKEVDLVIEPNPENPTRNWVVGVK